MLCFRKATARLETAGPIELEMKPSFAGFEKVLLSLSMQARGSIKYKICWPDQQQKSTSRRLNELEFAQFHVSLCPGCIWLFVDCSVAALNFTSTCQQKIARKKKRKSPSDQQSATCRSSCSATWYLSSQDFLVPLFSYGQRIYKKCGHGSKGKSYKTNGFLHLSLYQGMFHVFEGTLFDP